MMLHPQRRSALPHQSQHVCRHIEAGCMSTWLARTMLTGCPLTNADAAANGCGRRCNVMGSTFLVLDIAPSPEPSTEAWRGGASWSPCAAVGSFVARVSCSHPKAACLLARCALGVGVLSRAVCCLLAGLAGRGALLASLSEPSQGCLCFLALTLRWWQ